VWVITIVDDDAGDAECLLHLIEGIDHIIRFGEVAWDVQLIFGAVGFFHGTSGDANFEAFRSKVADDGLADVGTCADYEGDWGFCCHCVMSGLLLISVLRSEWFSDPLAIDQKPDIYVQKYWRIGVVIMSFHVLIRDFRYQICLSASAVCQRTIEHRFNRTPSD
jgi:hypothetical protein